MTQRLAEFRKSVGTFEVVDIPGDAAVSAIRGRLSVPSATEVRWNSWEYGSEVAELRRLYEKGKRAQWNATDDIDWSLPVSKDEWIGNPEGSLLANV